MYWSDRKHRNCDQQKLLCTSKNGEMRVPRSRSKRKISVLLRSNLKCARRAWGKLPASLSNSLVELTEMHALSIAAGHLQLLGKRWYITHSGLLHVGYRNHCSGIRAELQGRLSDPGTNRWVFRATVYKTPHSKGFIGYGDADPSNVSPLVRGAEMRIAETRAVNRALRKAYGMSLFDRRTWYSFHLDRGPSGLDVCKRNSLFELQRRWSAAPSRSTLCADPPVQA